MKINGMEEARNKAATLLTTSELEGDEYYEREDFITDIIENRGEHKDFYVLRYDVKTTAYNNEIEFKNFDDAYEEYEQTSSNYPDERIELIFAPVMNDQEYFDNELLVSKMTLA